jgi:tetratricopeptide (TPR) repeat protein
MANADKDPQLQKIFNQGLNAFNSGNYQSAIKYFRKMLENNPNLLRPRLELARSLYRQGEYKVAKYHFEQVLSAPELLAVVRKNVNAFLLLIRQQLPSLSLSLSVSLNEKIPKRTKKVIYLGGIPFNGDNAPYENTGITQDSYQFTAQSKIPINPKQKTFAKLRLEHSEIINSENDSTYLKATIGKHYSLANAATITPEIGFHHSIYQDKKLYSGRIFSLKYFKPIAKADYLNLNYNYRKLDYIDSHKSSNGVQNEFSIGYIKLPSVSSRLDASLGLLKSNTQNKSQSFDKLSLNLSYNQDISNAWNVSINFRINRTHFGAVASSDKEVKKDREITHEITLLNKLWQINNIAPKLTIGKTKNRSNIDNYGKSEPYIKLGFTQQF